jgi:hypothetical protein
MNKLTCTLAFLTPMLLGGCATVTTGTTEKVSLEVQGPSDGHCSVDIAGALPQHVFSGQTFTVTRSSAPMTLRCWAQGFDTTTLQVQASVQERARIGLPMGMLVDYLSGARYEYPSQITVSLRPTGPLATLNTGSLNLTGP